MLNRRLDLRDIFRWQIQIDHFTTSVFQRTRQEADLAAAMVVIERTVRDDTLCLLRSICDREIERRYAIFIYNHLNWRGIIQQRPRLATIQIGGGRCEIANMLRWHIPRRNRREVTMQIAHQPACQRFEKSHVFRDCDLDRDARQRLTQHRRCRGISHLDTPRHQRREMRLNGWQYRVHQRIDQRILGVLRLNEADGARLGLIRNDRVPRDPDHQIRLNGAFAILHWHTRPRPSTDERNMWINRLASDLV